MMIKYLKKILVYFLEIIKHLPMGTYPESFAADYLFKTRDDKDT